MKNFKTYKPNLKWLKEDFRYLNFKGIEEIGDAVYMPLFGKKISVGFIPYEPSKTFKSPPLPWKTLDIVLTASYYEICGFEQADKTIIVYKDTKKCETLKDQDEFYEKYFTEAI